MFLIDSAWAQGGGGSDPIGLFLPLILIFVVFYFLLIRPQQKRQKAHQAKVTSISKGDEVLTNGGVFGKVTKVSDDLFVMVEVSKGVEVKVSRQMIADVINPKVAPEPPKSLFASLFGGGGSASTAEPEEAKSKSKKSSSKKPKSKS